MIPLLSDWTRENNRERQLTILGEMLGQEKIDQATYDAAAAEEVQFSDGYTNLGNFTEPTEDQGDPEKPTVQSTANNSYYTDQVISDVAAALVEKLGLEDDAPDENGNVRTAQEKAVSKIYSSGYKIYTLQDSKLQSIAESVFENSDLVEYTDDYGKPLAGGYHAGGQFHRQRGGYGGRSGRQDGGPWLELGHGAPAVRFCYQAHLRLCPGAGRRYHHRCLRHRRLSRPGFGRLRRMAQELPLRLLWLDHRVDGAGGVPLNTCAVRVNESYGSAASYNYMVEKLGFTTPDPAGQPAVR